MKRKIKFLCFNSAGYKQGEIFLQTEHEDPKLAFRENKALIKAVYPGAAFLKKPSKR